MFSTLAVFTSGVHVLLSMTVTLDHMTYSDSNTHDSVMMLIMSNYDYTISNDPNSVFLLFFINVYCFKFFILLLISP